LFCLWTVRQQNAGAATAYLTLSESMGKISVIDLLTMAEAFFRSHQGAPQVSEVLTAQVFQLPTLDYHTLASCVDLSNTAVAVLC
jgi:hypothetical protein